MRELKIGLLGLEKPIKMFNAREIKVIGRVQGVGFRPFIYSLANKYQIRGTVQNNMDGVLIRAEGLIENIDLMTKAIREDAPRLAKIETIELKEIEHKNYPDFEIIASETVGDSSLVIPIDSAVCDDCTREMKDPDNFRHNYPFINCTQCGPRYTIIESLPYDRERTAMRKFQMCERCAEEYNDISDRRHHAQPIACDLCGPEIQLIDMDEKIIGNKEGAIATTKKLLLNGAIVAIKGIGGYHLACDARNKAVINELRRRKNRPRRPLAVMSASLQIANEICYINDKELKQLQSSAAPIVVLKQKEENKLPSSLTPGMSTLGVMLPYAPLHHLIIDEIDLPLLVMTSANPSGMPILYKDTEAITYLAGIADYVLTSNREILHPLDDSVLQVYDQEICFFRRSRGYVPDPIFTDEKVDSIMALGGQQNNVFAIGRNNQIFLGPHIGDMKSTEIIDFFNSESQHLLKWMGTKPKKISIDLHPQYETRKLAEQFSTEIVEVQHHHAHLAACLEDNRVKEASFGLILDGTGYGPDGNIWGYELLYGDASRYERLAHLKYTPLPGGDRAVEEPWRNASGMLIEYFGEQGKSIANKLFADKSYEIDIINNMIVNGINTPYAGTCGRLFDAVSAMLGICEIASYDGEAAILLSEMMYQSRKKEMPYNYQIEQVDGIYEINYAEMIKQIIDDLDANREILEVVTAFHDTIVEVAYNLVNLVIQDRPQLKRNIALSGGSFLNRYLAENIRKKFESNNFNVFLHNEIPCGDGGLAFGQLIVAANQ